MTPHYWVQRNLPWLAVLAMLLGLERAEPEPRRVADELAG